MIIFLLVIVGLSLLILGHEAGHFFAAKKFGMKVDEFGFGFPPRIWAWRSKPKTRGNSSAKTIVAKKATISGENKTLWQVQSETEYSINLLPFGGFVKIAGEHDSLPSVVPPVRRSLSGGGSTGEGISEIASPSARNNNEGMVVIAEKEKQRLFMFQPAWKRVVVTGAGVAVNFVLGWILLSTILMIGVPAALVIGDVQPGSPAEAVGLMRGDVISGFEAAKDFISFIDQNRGREVILEIARGGKDVQFRAVPRVETAENEGALGVILEEIGERKFGFFAAIWEGLKRSFFIAQTVIIVFISLIHNLFASGSLLEGVVGPVGIFSVAQDVGGISLVYLIQLISLISINLAVINLIPFPALDGGRLLLILVEKIKGTPIPRRAEALVNGLGFAFLIFLMVTLTIRDIGNLL